MDETNMSLDDVESEMPRDGMEADAEEDGQTVLSPEADMLPWADSVSDRILREEAEDLCAIYPDFDLDAAFSDPAFGPILRGERSLTLRQLYEAVNLERIIEDRVATGLEAAVAEALETALPAAVESAVAEREESLLAHIRARGQRPAENGTSSASGIRLHPAVDRLTRRERAMLAERAERGEMIRL